MDTEKAARQDAFTVKQVTENRKDEFISKARIALTDCEKAFNQAAGTKYFDRLEEESVFFLLFRTRIIKLKCYKIWMDVDKKFSEILCANLGVRPR
jgi:hypothetical protein